METFVKSVFQLPLLQNKLFHCKTIIMFIVCNNLLKNKDWESEWMFGLTEYQNGQYIAYYSFLINKNKMCS